MVSKMQVDAKVVVTGKANNLLKGMTKMALREAVISGYGSVGETEIGYVATHAYDYAETIRSLAAPALANDAKHSAFAVFRDAIAEAAENPTEAFQTAKQVATGENYTNFYSDLVSGQKMIETDLLTASEGSVEAALKALNELGIA